jgi:hypothetical protein
MTDTDIDDERLSTASDNTADIASPFQCYSHVPEHHGRCAAS